MLPHKRGEIKLQIFKEITKTIASAPVFGGNGVCRRPFRPLPITPAENLGGGSGVTEPEEKKIIEFYSVMEKSSVPPNRGKSTIFNEIAKPDSPIPLVDGGGEFRLLGRINTTPAENLGGGSGVTEPEEKKIIEFYSVMEKSPVPPNRGKIMIFKEIAKTDSTTPLFDGGGEFRRLRRINITPAENLGGRSGAAATEGKKISEYYSVVPKRGDVKSKIFKGIFQAIVSTIRR